MSDRDYSLHHLALLEEALVQALENSGEKGAPVVPSLTYRETARWLLKVIEQARAGEDDPFHLRTPASRPPIEKRKRRLIFHKVSSLRRRGMKKTNAYNAVATLRGLGGGSGSDGAVANIYRSEQRERRLYALIYRARTVSSLSEEERDELNRLRERIAGKK